MIKKYRKLSPVQLADSPLNALYGLSRKNAKLLNKSLNLYTIRDLSTLKYITWARSIDYKHRLVRDYEEKPLEDVANAHVHAMQGISSKKTKILEDKLNIHTIEDLAEYSYGRIAHEICRFEKSPDEYNPIEYESYFTAQYKNKSLKQILRSPVTAFRGLGKAEASALSDSLGVKSIKNLGTQKYIVWARDIIDLYNAEKKLTAPSQEKPTKKSIFKPAAAIIFLIIAIIAGLAIFIYNNTIPGESTKTPLSTDPSGTLTPTVSEIPGSIHESQENDYIKYRIQQGDTLVIISQKIYGTYERWPEIYRLNRNIIDHPARIFPGHTINLPPK
ncbi:MAG: LysM peptidoglycan-binding domain-containing protein [Spirochaetota bacterium]